MKDSIRQKIVEKARDLLFTKTEEEITMNLVANELSITAPTLYHYFKGKGEMLEAANQLIVNEISSTLELKFPPSIPFEMRIITAVAMTGDYFMKTGLPASYLIEDPRERPIVLGEFRKKLAAQGSYPSRFHAWRGRPRPAADPHTDQPRIPRRHGEGHCHDP